MLPVLLRLLLPLWQRLCHLKRRVCGLCETPWLRWYYEMRLLMRHELRLVLGLWCRRWHWLLLRLRV